MLGEQHDGDARIGLPDAARGTGPVVGEVRWHAYVDDGEIGLRLGHHVEECLGVRRAADDVVTRIDQQAGQPLAEQRRVLADHDPHGSTASIVVPVPTGLVITSDPPMAATLSARPANPEPCLLYTSDAADDLL